MIEKSYFYRKASEEQYFEYSTTRIALREYIENLIFYNSFNNQTAEVAFFDKTPYELGTVELRDHGTFGACVTVKAPIKYDKKNLDTLQKTGTISFNIGINKLEGFSKQTIFLDNWPENMPEDDYSFTLTAGRESTKPVNFHLGANATKEDVLNTILVAVDPSIFKAEVDVSGDLTNVIIKSAYPGEIIDITDGTYGTNLLSILSVGNKIFGCYPINGDQELLTFNNENNSYSIKVIHANEENESIFKVEFYNKEGELKTTLRSKWENDGSNLTNIEIDFDYDVAYLFLDGELKDFQSTNFEREFGGELWVCGTENNPYTYDEIYILSTITHTASFDTRETQLTKYTATRPYIDFFWKGNDISSDSLNQFVVSATPNIHFILYVDNQAYYYLSGAWRDSDGTFNQSNDLGTFVAKVSEFDLNNNEIAIRAFFNSDGTSPAYIENLYFELDDTSIYGDEAEAPAILVGTKKHENIPIDIYGKKLIITTDKGVTEIEFEGEYILEVNDECEVMTGCNQFILDIDAELVLQEALRQIPEVILDYEPLTVTRDILVKNKFILKKDIILDIGGNNMAGENDALVILQAGAKVQGNGISLTQSGTYRWLNNMWVKDAATTIVSTVEEFLAALTNGDNITVSAGSNIVLTGTDFNVADGQLIRIDGSLTLPTGFVGSFKGMIDVYGTFDNQAYNDLAQTWGWLAPENGATDVGKIVVHTGGQYKQNSNVYIGNTGAIFELKNGTFILSYAENILEGNAVLNENVQIYDKYVITNGSSLTVEDGKEFVLVGLNDPGMPTSSTHLGGSLTGNVLWSNENLITNISSNIVDSTNANTTALPIGTIPNNDITLPWVQVVYNRIELDSLVADITKNGAKIFSKELPTTAGTDRYLQVAMGHITGEDKLDLETADYPGSYTITLTARRGTDIKKVSTIVSF